MKKRIVATLLVGAVAASSVIGLSACGGSVSLPKGESVNVDQWVEALTVKMLAGPENYTLNGSSSEQYTVKGTVKEDDKTKDLSYTSKTTTSDTWLYNKEAKSYYYESTESENAKLTYDGETSSSKSKSTSKEYLENSSDKYWYAEYSKTDRTTKNPSYNSDGVTEYHWYARESSEWSLMSGDAYSNIAEYFTGTYYEKTEDAENHTNGKSIVELYEKFSYSGGIYTATLYKNEWIEAGIDGFYAAVECKLSISFNGDGYVIGAGEKINASDKYEEDGVKLDYTVKIDRAYAATNIKNTDPSSKSNNDIKKAIEKAKEEA